MRKFVCTVCGYVYDEAAGIPDAGIAPGTRWEELPDDWVCPVCGASKAEFAAQDEGAPDSAAKPDMPAAALETDMRELSALEVSALLSNLARGCEKQYKADEAALFKELSDWFKAASVPAEEPSLGELSELIEKDLSAGIPASQAVCSEQGDRGALRALVWCEKVTKVLRSLVARYEKEDDAMLENTGVFVCTICGFVFIGDTPPALCPVCKVPGWKFEKIEGRAV